MNQLNEIKQLQKRAGILTENYKINEDYDHSELNDFIMDNGGTIDALQFQQLDDVESKMREIEDDRPNNGKEPYDFDWDYNDDAAEEFEKIFGINPNILKGYWDEPAQDKLEQDEDWDSDDEFMYADQP